MREPDSEIIWAAGGLVWWDSPEGRRLAVIHRPRYDDWALPKGKLKPGESLREAALREVVEEIGCQVRITGFAGALGYAVKGVPKVVLFWTMERTGAADFVAADEVDQIEWLPPREAVRRLDYPLEKQFVETQLSPRAGRHERAAR